MFVLCSLSNAVCQGFAPALASSATALSPSANSSSYVAGVAIVVNAREGCSCAKWGLSQKQTYLSVSYADVHNLRPNYENPCKQDDRKRVKKHINLRNLMFILFLATPSPWNQSVLSYLRLVPLGTLFHLCFVCSSDLYIHIYFFFLLKISLSLLDKHKPLNCG